MSDDRIVESSGNVFADLGLLDAEEALAKADLTREIVRIIRRRSWTQAQAAGALGIDQPKVSALMRGRLEGFSTERLIRFLNDLGQEVEISVRPQATMERARLRVRIEEGEPPVAQMAARAAGAVTVKERVLPEASTVNAAAQANSAQQQSMVEAIGQAVGATSAVAAMQEAIPRFSAAEFGGVLLGGAPVLEGLRGMSATSIVAMASDALRAFGTSPAMRDLTTVAEGLAGVDSSQAMRELRGPAALLKGFDFEQFALGARESAAVALRVASGADQVADAVKMLSEAMAGLFASGAVAIAFRTAEGFVEVKRTGDVVRIPVDEGEAIDEIVEVAVGEGITLQERVHTRQLRLVIGSLYVEVDATEVRAVGD